MRKMLLIAGLLSLPYLAYAVLPIGHKLAPQYRVWKTSDIGTAAYVGNPISTSPIIFHMVIGSPTYNVGGGDSYFVLLQSSGMLAPDFEMSTKAFVPLDAIGNNFPGTIGTPFDILVTTHSFYNKQGGARIQYLWDYLDSGALWNGYPDD